MNPRILVTGAASGIGQATADALRARGATVIGLDVNGEGEGILACDVRDQGEVDRAVAQAVERLGGLDVLINNAGIGNPQSAGTRPDEAAQAVIDVNLMGPWRVTAAALPALRESRGRVVNVASGLAHLTVPLATAYCMSKRGLVAYSDALRVEHGDAISVTTVYPGYIRTPIHDAPAAAGVSLEGLVPSESIDGAVAALVRASLDSAPPRDLATSSQGRFGYWLLRHAPRVAVDRVMARRLRGAIRRGAFERAEIAQALRSRF